MKAKGGKTKKKSETEADTGSVPLRAAVILCEGTPDSHAI